MTVLVLVVAAVRALDSPSSIAYYRAVDEHTLVVGTVEGPGAWTRVTNLVETPVAVTITVSSFLVRLGPGTSEGVPVETTVSLRDPIAARSVVDGRTGLPVRGTTCLPPAVFAPDCATESAASIGLPADNGLEARPAANPRRSAHAR